MPKPANKNILFSKIRLHLWRWHRRLGLLSALFVILLAVTGILLNHGNRLGLDARFLPQKWLALFYNIEAPAIISHEVEQDIVSQLGGRQLFLNELAVGECAGDLLGAQPEGDLVVIACTNKLLLVTRSGELVDQLGAVNGLPIPITLIGRCKPGICWQSQDQSYALNLDTMQWQASAAVPRSEPNKISTPPALRDVLTRTYGGEISWERWLLDLHSGRLLGVFGPWLMDFMAIFFMILAGTGVLMWGLGRRHKH